MKRIATPNRAVDLFGAGKDGYRSAVAGVSTATEFSALWFNHMQEALARTREAAGIAVPADNDFDWFMTSLNAMFARLDSAAFTESPTAPTPAQFDSSLELATTEFVRRNGLHFATPVLINAATVLSNAHSGKFVLLTGTGHTTNLPACATSVDGATIYLKNNGTGVMSIQKNAADSALTIDGTPATLFTLAVGEAAQATFIAAIGLWDISGVGALQHSRQFARSTAANGYQKLPGGLIFQWGTGANTYTTDTGQDVYFPIAFPTACIFCLVGDAIGAGGGVMSHLLNFKTTTKVNCYSTMTIANGYVTHIPNYIAIGY